MERYLIVELRILACRQLLRRCRDELTDAVVHVPSLGGHTALREIVDRSVCKQLDSLALTDDVMSGITDHAANLILRDHDWLSGEIECIAQPRHRGKLEEQSDLPLVRALEDRSLRIEAEQSRCPSQMRLQDLANVHAARYAERVEDDVDRPSVRKERHVFLG